MKCKQIIISIELLSCICHSHSRSNRILYLRCHLLIILGPSIAINIPIFEYTLSLLKHRWFMCGIPRIKSTLFDFHLSRRYRLSQNAFQWNEGSHTYSIESLLLRSVNIMFCYLQSKEDKHFESGTVASQEMKIYFFSSFLMDNGQNDRWISCIYLKIRKRKEKNILWKCVSKNWFLIRSNYLREILWLFLTQEFQSNYVLSIVKNVKSSQ